MARQDELQAIVDPAVRALGFELWGLEHIAQGRHSLLRIYIDGESGVTVDDCAEVSRQVSAVMDVEDPISGEYTLEVSSPGINRTLFQLEQYTRYIGEPVKLRLRAPFEGRRKFSGSLAGIEGDDVVVRIEDEEYLLPFGSIEKAVVEPVLDSKESSAG